MSREISRAEAWEKAHDVFSQINFNAFDYNTIKESLLDYTKLYFPEDFNDYIESSEFIAILELFAYISELLAYRIDMNAHENFITTAQRKESVLRLAKLISYKTSRNIPARGLVKLTSIQTTEPVLDSTGRNLSGTRIFWNDSNNNDWKEQFMLVMNRALSQKFGSVSPSERTQIDDVLFELYTINNNPLNNTGVFKFSGKTDGESVPMELVPVSLDKVSGIRERRPEIETKFSLLYANDGLGDSSDTTGFLMYAKQGTLSRITKTFDGLTPNQTFEINADNINETDVWMNNINPDTGRILTVDPNAESFPHLVAEDLRYGEWIEVDLANAQNIIFNTNKNRHKYEIEALDNDQIRIIFGDGEFSDIPSGTFEIWHRRSANIDTAIERNSVINQSSTFTYMDVNNTTQTITFTFSLINSLQNASASEDIEHIRRVAPSVYYTQDRMVNGRDYNIFMLQDPSILRMRAVNRTYAGDSKYISWHEPRDAYEDVKIFGDDMALYWKDSGDESLGQWDNEHTATAISPDRLIREYIEPLLSSTDFFSILSPELLALGKDPGSIRRRFNGSSVPYSFDTTSNELAAITTAISAAYDSRIPVEFWYSPSEDVWVVNDDDKAELEAIIDDKLFHLLTVAIPGASWEVSRRSRRLVAQSQQTKFWNTNASTSLVNFNSLNASMDSLVLLKANSNSEGTKVLSENYNYSVLGLETDKTGMPDIHKLSVLPEDTNNDGIADNITQPEIFDTVITGVWPDTVPSNTDIPVTEDGMIDLTKFGKRFNNGSAKERDSEIQVYVNGVRYFYDAQDLVPASADSSNIQGTGVSPVTRYITFNSSNGARYPLPQSGDEIRIVITDYVYFSRESETAEWVPHKDTDLIRSLYLVESTDIESDINLIRSRLYKKHHGRYPMNFAWLHHTPSQHLVDPSTTNIIDMFIITTGYYTSLQRYLSGNTTTPPTIPTPMELRNSYARLLDNKMISDTVVLQPGKFKILFGSRAIPALRCKFKVIRPEVSSMTDNQVKVNIINAVREFFNIDSWEFGETFYFTEVSTAIHTKLGPEIDSVVIVPTYSQNYFGDMFQVVAREDEMFIPDINTTDIDIVSSYTPENIKQINDKGNASANNGTGGNYDWTGQTDNGQGNGNR